MARYGLHAFSALAQNGCYPVYPKQSVAGYRRAFLEISVREVQVNTGGCQYDTAYYEVFPEKAPYEVPPFDTHGVARNEHEGAGNGVGVFPAE